MFACGYGGVRVAVLFEKLAHFLAFAVKVGVRTLILNSHVMLRLVSYVEVFCSLLYSFGSFLLPLC